MSSEQAKVRGGGEDEDEDGDEEDGEDGGCDAVLQPSSAARRRASPLGPTSDVGWTPTFGGAGHWDVVDVLGRRTTIAGGVAAAGAKERGGDGNGKAKESLGRTLSRKVSGRWRKQGGAVVDTVADGERQLRMATAGRISMQERRKTGGPLRRDGGGGNLGEDDDARRLVVASMHKRRSLRLSIDKFSDLVDEQQPPVPSLARHGAAAAQERHGCSAWHSHRRRDGARKAGC